MERDSVSLKQMAAAVFAGLFAPISRLLPKESLIIAGKNCMAAPLLALPPLLLMTLLFGRLMKNRKEGEGLTEALRSALGRRGGTAAALLLGIWIAVYGGFTVRSGAERLLSTAYPTGSAVPIVAAMLALSLVSALGEVRYAVRCSVMLSGLFGAVLTLIFITVLPEIKPQYLLPVNPAQSGKALLSALPIINVVSPWVYFGFLGGHVRREERAARIGVKFHILILAGILMLMVCTVGTVGPELIRRQQFPVFAMLRNIRTLRGIGSVEPLVVAVWMITDFIFVTLLLLTAAEIFTRVLNIPDHRYAAVPCAAVMFVSAMLIAADEFAFIGISERIVPAVNLTAISALLILSSAAGAVRKKIKEKRKKGIDKAGRA
ncbi:MAG: GerAB/ArcD/ProY family transporter [Oscillospiraceae bacterium]|nr:GerAB/ArcD/ProY family transporter [Oscillospiraceae bacterium]